MNFSDYAKLAGTTEPMALPRWHPDQQRMIHAALGIMTEAGELTDPIKKHVIYNQPLTPDKIHNIFEEIGDLLWYIAILCNIFGWSFETIMQSNIEKLSRRYPEGFTEQAALERADKREA